MEDAIKEHPFDNYTTLSNSTKINHNDKPFLDFSDEISIMENQGIDGLLDRLNILLCRGQMTTDSRLIIKDAITQYQTLYLVTIVKMR